MPSAHNKPLKRSSPAFRISPVAAACALIAFQASGVQAQQAPAAESADSVVVIKGIRKSLETSLNLKRTAHGVVDGIVAEDIGKFPDTNLAESMQRISGVSIDRSNGEGSKITVRGVGPDYQLILLNGRQMPGSSLGDTSASSSRSFDFANLASESIAALEVYKTMRAEQPTGGIGAVVNIKTARPLDSKETIASFGVKMVHDASNERLPDSLKGSTYTPEYSGIVSTTFAENTFGVSLSGSYQKRDYGANVAQVSNGWRTFKGDENNWGTIPQNGTPGSENIVNRPGPNDIYSVPQNLNYSVTGLERERTNGQLTLQYAPSKDLKATLDFTYSENKIHGKRNELSAWFNFGPSASVWTNGPAAGPLFYSEIINPATSDIAMGGAMFGTKNENNSTGFNLAWKFSNKLSFDFDAHSSTATSGSDSPYGSSAVLGTASFNRGTTSVDWSHDFPVLSIEGSQIDPALQQVTGSSFRNSYMKSGVDQVQTKGQYKLDSGDKLDFGVSLTKVNNRSAFANVQRDSWGGASSAADYPDSVWHADSMGQYFSRVDGSKNTALFGNFFTWDFKTVRDLADAAAVRDGHPGLYQASTDFTTDRRTREESKSAFIQYGTDWELGVPVGATFGLRYEKTDVTSSALVPIATGLTWVGNNEFSLAYGAPGFTKLNGSYKYFLPSLDLEADLTSELKLRASAGESIGRQSWADIQGGQTLTQLVRIDGGTGQQGNPALKPLLSKNLDLSLEYYYAKASYLAVGVFQKKINNYVSTGRVAGTPFNIHTPAGGSLFLEAISAGNCAAGDLTCIRNYIFLNHDGTQGVVRGPDDANGNQTGTIAGQPNDPLTTFLIATPSNSRADKLNGIEFNVQHTFWNTGFGVGFNYTISKSGLKYDNTKLGEQYALEGVSNSTNLVGFYEDKAASVRLAYNWRGQFLASRFDPGGNPNPIYTEAYGQWDMSLGYKLNDKLSFQAEFINLGDAIQRQHSRTKEELISVTQTGRRYMLGARYAF